MNTEGNTLSSEAQSVAELLEQLIERNVIDVPILPEVANKALLLAQNPESDARDMANLIQGDQSLAGHVMRIANSAAYTPLSNLVSLQQAIARLGMGVISEIALTAAIGAKFFNTPGYEDYVEGIWRHAVATSLWSKEIARNCRSNVEVAFLAGLLHSIGRPAVIQSILEIAKNHQFNLSDDDVHQLENRYCKRISETVIKLWKMPTLVIEAINFYDNYEQSTSTVNQAAQVNAGLQFATHMLAPEAVSRAAVLALPALTTLNMYQDEIETLLNQTQVISARMEGLAG